MKRSLFDPLFVIPILGLSSLSLSIIGSTNPALFVNQFIFFVIGIALYFIFSQLDYRIYTRLTIVLYVVSFLLLFITFWGPTVRGATRWIDVFGFRLQSSEIIKPFIFVLLSHFLSSHPVKQIKNLFFSLLIFTPIFLMIFKQPDLGNALVYSGIFIFILLNAGLPLIYFITASVISALLIPTLWSILHDYQKARITSFLNPNIDPKGTGYNALQAIIAIGAGGLWGLGLGRGTQSHLQFLPEFHTDFIFASLVEEFGFLGGIIVLVFYTLLLLKIINIAFHTEDLFGRLICIAVFSQILIQLFINIGMNVGILPITGITLPLVSYGGSSIMGIFISLGMVQSISKRINRYLF